MVNHAKIDSGPDLAHMSWSAHTALAYQLGKLNFCTSNFPNVSYTRIGGLRATSLHVVNFCWVLETDQFLDSTPLC